MNLTFLLFIQSCRKWIIPWHNGMGVSRMTLSWNSVSFQKLYTDSPRYMWSFYLQFCVFAIKKWPFSGICSLIYSHPWSFYMQILSMRVYFWSPYLFLKTRETSIMYLTPIIMTTCSLQEWVKSSVAFLL